MSRRTVLIAAAGAAVVVAAVVASLTFFAGSEGSADPNETTVTDMCRDAAEDQPGMTEGVADFKVSTMTHEVEDGITFYQANGTASTSDGFGGESSYRFQCRTKLVADGARWELIDITLL